VITITYTVRKNKMGLLDEVWEPKKPTEIEQWYEQYKKDFPEEAKADEVARDKAYWMNPRFW
jgi:hypothetical protein